MTSRPAAAEIVALDAVALSAAIHRRDVSCVEVLDACFTQIDRLNPRVNAIVALQDRDPLRRLARERDAQLAAGRSLGPLHGFPQAPKDILPVAGLPTTRGSRLFRDTIATTDAVMYERMRAGGALFVGRTNTPEFGLGGHTYNDVYGRTGNAFDPALSAGGSSGGAAVAVALRMLPVADGSDMMGSLRTPAAFNHVFGFRTTPGVVPHGPGEEVFWQQFTVSGPMARNVPDLAFLLAAVGGFDARWPLSRRAESPDRFAAALGRDFAGTRIAWLGDFDGQLATEPGVLETCTQALEHFRTIGCSVEQASPQFELARLWQAWLALRSFAFAGAHAALYRDPARRALMKPEAVWEVEQGLALTALAVYDAARERSAWYQALQDLFRRFDFVVLPAAQVFPFDGRWHWPREVGGRAMDTYHRWMECVVPATMASLPALAAPAGIGPGGRPAGLQIIGPTQCDFEVLQLGHAYAQASGCAAVASPLLA
jgi:amidase